MSNYFEVLEQVFYTFAFAVYMGVWLSVRMLVGWLVADTLWLSRRDR